jgi:uncharacterized FlgJ-related protein
MLNYNGTIDDTCSLTQGEQHKFRIFRSKRNEAIGLRKYIILLSTNIRMSKLRRIRWMGHAAYEEMRTAHN